MEKIVLIDENPELEKNELRVLNNQTKVKVKVIQDGQDPIEKLMFLSKKAIHQLKEAPSAEEVKVEPAGEDLKEEKSEYVKEEKPKKKKKKFFGKD